MVKIIDDLKKQTANYFKLSKYTGRIGVDGLWLKCIIVLNKEIDCTFINIECEEEHYGSLSDGEINQLAEALGKILKELGFNSSNFDVLENVVLSFNSLLSEEEIQDFFELFYNVLFERFKG